MPKIIDTIRQFANSHGKKRTMRALGIGEYALNSLVLYEDGETIHIATLIKAYEYFGLEHDDFFHEQSTRRSSMKKHDGIVGQIFRARRIRLGLSVKEVERRAKISRESIERLERGAQLPRSGSETVRRLLRVYEFTEEEREAVLWLIIRVYECLDLFRDDLEKLLKSGEESYKRPHNLEKSA